MKIFSRIVLACVLLQAAPTRAQEIVVTNLDRLVPANPTFTRLSQNQWLAAGFTTGGTSFELDHIRPAIRLTTLSSQIVAELREGGGAPGAPIQTFTPLFGDFLPDAPVMLAANTSYYFSLGYLAGVTALTDWFHTTTNLTWDGPGALDDVYVSANQGGTWATGGNLSDLLMLIEVVAVPEPGAPAAALVASASLAALRRRS